MLRRLSDDVGVARRTKDALAVVKQRVAIHGQKKHPEVKRLGIPLGPPHLKGPQP